MLKSLSNKNELQALNRYLLLIHAFLLAVAAAVRIFLTEPLRIGDSQSVIVSTFGIILFVLIAVGISFATSLLTAIRFYKNLFSDEVLNVIHCRSQEDNICFPKRSSVLHGAYLINSFYLEASF